MQLERKTQVQRREESEKRMLTAATNLVAQKGAYAVTLAEIGEMAGYSRGLPAHHFGTKTNFMKALAQHLAKNFSVFTNKSLSASLGRKRLNDMIEAYLRRDTKSWASGYALIMLIAEARLIDDDLVDYMVEYNNLVLSYLRRNIAKAMQDGDMNSDRNVNEIADFLLCAVRGAILLKILNPDQNLENVYNQMIEYLDM